MARQPGTRAARKPARRRPARRRGPAAPAWHEAELERALAREKARYGSLIEALPLIVYEGALDVQGSFTFISPRVEALLGFAPRAWIGGGKFWLERLHRDDRRRVLPLLARAHRGGHPFRAEYRLLDRSGEPRWILDESRVARDASGRPLFVQGTWTDIGERKRLELETAGRSRALRSSEAELERFVSAASHELMAPLRRIANLGELLARRAGPSLDEDSRGQLARMRASAERLQRLVAGLVDYWEHGRLRRQAVLVDVGAALDAAAADLAEPLARSGAEIGRGSLPPVWADPTLVRRVLANLLDNAVKFSGGRRPRIRVWGERADDRRAICVRDNGIGMDARQARQAFSQFDPEHPGHQRDAVGLGLPLCRRIVEELGGDISVESEPGEGSTFRVTLPAPPRDAP